MEKTVSNQISNEFEKKPKIYERNPDTGEIRWRYFGDYGNEKPYTPDCSDS